MEHTMDMLSVRPLSRRDTYPCAVQGNPLGYVLSLVMASSIHARAVDVSTDHGKMSMSLSHYILKGYVESTEMAAQLFERLGAMPCVTVGTSHVPLRCKDGALHTIGALSVALDFAADRACADCPVQANCTRCNSNRQK